MVMAGEFTIAWQEQFPHLPHAPIVEAVIDIRAQAEGAWKETDVSPWLKEKLPDYPQPQSPSGSLPGRVDIRFTHFYRDAGR